MEDKKIEELITQFWEEYQKELKQFPYQINLLDIVRNGHNSNVNEDAHSRILVNLLQYEQNGKFPILESFVNNCLGFDFKNIVDPQVTYHNDYVDVLIEIGNKAIIIENKINEARDQNKQLERYIAATKEKHSDIYAVYLTREGGEPDENSLSSENKEELMSQDRYRSINYREDIILWLTENVLPQIVYKEKPLILNINLYIDYLLGLFGQRENELNTTIKILEKMNIIDNKSTIDYQIKRLESFIELTKTYKDKLIDLKMEQIINSINQSLPDGTQLVRKKINKGKVFTAYGIETNTNVFVGISFDHKEIEGIGIRRNKSTTKKNNQKIFDKIANNKDGMDCTEWYIMYEKIKDENIPNLANIINKYIKIYNENKETLEQEFE